MNPDHCVTWSNISSVVHSKTTYVKAPNCCRCCIMVIVIGMLQLHVYKAAHPKKMFINYKNMYLIGAENVLVLDCVRIFFAIFINRQIEICEFH